MAQKDTPDHANRGLSRRAFLGAASAAGALGMLGMGARGEGRMGRKPNLLFVFSDQQSWDMLGCMGNEDIKTPRLDAFAAQGTRFNHCVSSYPVCTPYRAMLLSGQHPLYNGAVSNDIPMIANNGPFLPEILRDAGYRMGYVGKWHLLGGDRDRPIPEGPMRYGFDGPFHTNNCHVNYTPGQCFYWSDAGEKVYFDEWEVYGQTRQALSFLDECRDDEPFALFVSWHPPHDVGWQPGTLVRNYGTIPELMAEYDPAALRLRPSVEDSPAVRRAYQGHYAMCTGVDNAFGWLMDKLEEKGLAEDTLVVFTSDHGDNLSSYGRTIPKNYPEDTSVRVPLLMRWPGRIPQDQASDLLVGAMDLMPSLLGLLGHEPPGKVQGSDLSKEIGEGSDGNEESKPLMFLMPSWRGIYTREHTYAEGEGPHWRFNDKGKYALGTQPVRALYDRSSDPHQLRNLHGEKSHAALQKALRAQTQQWLDRFEDPVLPPGELMRLVRGENNQPPMDAQAPGFSGRPIDKIRKRRA